ncbi:hypothetical protein GQ53DRAFT_826144 [Thozetella sp. PMI_491]|nr:hypothetical protein GQ53DRAFT_826144 [Thozetella sp. PMI_491]
MSGTIRRCIDYWDYGRGYFQGDLMTVLCRTRMIGTHDKVLDILEQIGKTGHVDYSNSLPYYMPGSYWRALETDSRAHKADLLEDGEPYSKDDPTLQRLLALGADPDPEGFRVTPLQISVFARNLPGVRQLLAAGADPNNAGDPQGISWDKDGFVLQSYDELHGLAPIDVLYCLERVPYTKHFLISDGLPVPRLSYKAEGYNGAIAVEIERLLLQYGATPSRIKQWWWEDDSYDATQEVKASAKVAWSALTGKTGQEKPRALKVVSRV